MEITNKNELKIGDVIRFYNWGEGGFLFGLITECEEEPHTHNTTHIWRARSHFSLNDVDAITLIENIKDIKEYEIIKQYYMDNQNLPNKIMVREELEDKKEVIL